MGAPAHTTAGNKHRLCPSVPKQAPNTTATWEESTSKKDSTKTQQLQQEPRLHARQTIASTNGTTSTQHYNSSTPAVTAPASTQQHYSPVTLQASTCPNSHLSAAHTVPPTQQCFWVWLHINYSAPACGYIRQTKGPCCCRPCCCRCSAAAAAATAAAAPAVAATAAATAATVPPLLLPQPPPLQPPTVLPQPSLLLLLSYCVVRELPARELW